MIRSKSYWREQTWKKKIHEIFMKRKIVTLNPFPWMLYTYMFSERRGNHHSLHELILAISIYLNCIIVCVLAYMWVLSGHNNSSWKSCFLSACPYLIFLHPFTSHLLWENINMHTSVGVYININTTTNSHITISHAINDIHSYHFTI